MTDSINIRKRGRPRKGEERIIGEREANGRFVKGKSPNPGGMPRGGMEAKRVKALARAYGKEALETIVEVMRNKAEPGKTRVYAAEVILTRGFGRPEAEKPDDDLPHGVLNPEQADRVMSLLTSGALLVRKGSVQ